MFNLSCSKKKAIKKIISSLTFEQLHDEMIRLSLFSQLTDVQLYYYKVLQKRYNKEISKIIYNPNIN